VTAPAPAAALVLARAPRDPAALAGLAPLLDADRRAALHAVLIRRAAEWAAAVAPGAAYVAVAPAEGVPAVTPAEGVSDAVVAPAEGVSAVAPAERVSEAAPPEGVSPAAPAEGVSDVAALLPPGVTAFAGGPAEALARIGRGPVLIARADCPRLGPAHAAAALADLAAGCDVVFGATLEGGWYLAGLREPRAELLTVAPESGGIAPVLQRARELDAEVGMLRHERVLATPADAAALLADPLLPPELRAALSA